jgi:hypothetical protein
MLRLSTLNLSYNAKRSLLKGFVVGGITVIAYLLIVIVTTPGLPPIAAVNAAFAINSPIIFGTATGTGAQSFISNYSKMMGCSLYNKKQIVGASSGSITFSSFLSFFALVPLGCCGSWLLILSFLPSIFGSTLSVILIQYSTPLSYIGLTIVLGFVGLSAFKLYKELRSSRKVMKS